MLHFLAAVLGVALDRVLGEPPRFHPLVGFGSLAHRIEQRLNRAPGSRFMGLLAWSWAVLPWVALAAALSWGLVRYVSPWAAHALDAMWLALALGGRSLSEHAQRVADDLARGDLAAARQHVGWIVSRDTSQLDEAGVAKACIESTLENGNDAIFGALFWFALLGGPGVVLFRLANTLDAMWGYKTPRLLYFGWAAARIDDGLNWIPSRLTALTYALLGHTRNALSCWKTQAPTWDSPNAGPVMASGAGALGLQLGGAAIYHGQEEMRPPLGQGRAPCGADVAPACRLLTRGVLSWLVVWGAWLLVGRLLGVG